MTPRGFAPAKVNLFLHVGAPEPSGFHPLSSLMVFADVGDQLTFQPSEALELVIDGAFSEGLSPAADNLVLRAVRGLFQAVGRPAPTIRLHLDKVLPIAAGLGGGSSDAGAALRLIRDACGLPLNDEDLLAISAEIGADGPACFTAAPVLAEGRGERLSPGPAMPAVDCVLVNPRRPSPTGAVYRAYDDAGAPGSALAPDLPERFEDARTAAAFFVACRNDLEPPAVAMTPAIGAVLDMLRNQPQTLLARVSGSGATCFALCADVAEADALAEQVAVLHPDWWVRRCKLGDL